MLERIQNLKEKALTELEAVIDQDMLRDWRVKYLGRSAELGEILQGLADLKKEDRPLVGFYLNQ